MMNINTFCDNSYLSDSDDNSLILMITKLDLYKCNLPVCSYIAISEREHFLG